MIRAAFGDLGSSFLTYSVKSSRIGGLMFKKIQAVLILFFLISFAQVARADELTLYVFPSPGIDWSSPSSLAADTLAFGMTKKRSIGHVTVELTCGGNAPFHIMTGVSQVTNVESAKVLFLQGYGLGILFYDFKGESELEKDLTPELQTRFDSGKLSFINYKINHKTCERLETYVTEYLARGYDKHYGLTNRPLHGEGSGCSAFALSFLELAGIVEPEYSENKSLLVPRAIVGGPTTKQDVPIEWVLLWSRWAHKNEANIPLSFWDPDLMNDWIKKTWEKELSAPSGRYKLETHGNAVGLTLDRRKVKTPQGPIWLTD